MRTDDHDLRARGAELRGFRGDRRGKRRHAEALHVHRQRAAQRVDRHHADDSDLHAGRLDEHGAVHVRPLDGTARRRLDEIRRKERELGTRRRGLDRAARIAAERLARLCGVRGAEIEVVVADDCSFVAESLVRVDDERALAQVRLDAALKRVAGIDQHDGAAVGCACGAQVLEVAAKQGETAAALSRERVAMQIRRADDGQREDVLRLRAGTAGDAADREREREQ